MKACPFCGNNVPDEAIYCLNCSSVLNERQTFPAVRVKKKKKKAIAIIPRKKLMGIIAIVLSVAIVFTSCFFAIKSTKDNEPSKEKPSTTLSPVTEDNGENVTDHSSEQNSDIAEATETTTEKQGFFDKLFGKDETETETKENETSDKKPETTTKKQTLLDKLFGDDEDKKETSSTTKKAETTTKKQNSTSKPEVENEKNTNVSSSVTEPEATTNHETTTNKSEGSTTTTTTSTMTTTTTTTTQPTMEPTTELTTEPTYSSDEDFEYEYYSSSTTKISLTKYTGNANYVTVPVYIDGLMVVEIQSDTFKDNSNIQTIDIPDEGRSYLWLRNNCFNNLSSFETLNLYNNDIGMYGKFALYCPIKNINVTFYQYKFVDGALYQWNSQKWELIHFAGNPCYTTLNLADWCTGIEGGHNLKYADNLKVINVSKETAFVPTAYNNYNQNLEAINVEAGNPKFYSKDGVLFYKGSGSETNYTGAIYPYGKKDRVFVMPSGTSTFTLTFNLGTGNTNTYLEELHIPANCKLDRADYLSTYSTPFPNLKKIYIAEDHSQYTTIRRTYTGEMETF